MLRSSLIQVFPLSILVRTVPTWQQVQTSSRHPQQFSVWTVTKNYDWQMQTGYNLKLPLVGPGQAWAGLILLALLFIWRKGVSQHRFSMSDLILSCKTIVIFRETKLSYQDICNKVSGLDLSVIWKLQIISAGINNNQVEGRDPTSLHCLTFGCAALPWCEVTVLKATPALSCGAVTSQETLDLWSLSSLNSLLGHEKSLRFYNFVKTQK